MYYDQWRESLNSFHLRIDNISVEYTHFPTLWEHEKTLFESESLELLEPLEPLEPSGLNCTSDPIPPSYVENSEKKLRQNQYSIWMDPTDKRHVIPVSIPKRESLTLIPEPGVPIDKVPSFLHEEVGVLYDKIVFPSNSLKFTTLSLGKQFRILTSVLPNDSSKCNHVDRSVNW